MNQKPPLFYVAPEQVGQQDVNYFLQQALARQFDGQNYCVVAEQTQDRLDPRKPGTTRKIKSYAIEAGGVTHNIHFDITDVSAVNLKTAGWA